MNGASLTSSYTNSLETAHKEIYRQDYVPHLQTTPGAKEFLERLKAENIQIVAAISGGDDVDGALKQVGLKVYFEEKASSQDTSHSKPDPNIIQVALKKAGLRPEEAVMIGDTAYDIEAASKAGVRTIAVLTGGWKREDLAHAAAVYASLQDLLEQFERSLLHSSAR